MMMMMMMMMMKKKKKNHRRIELPVHVGYCFLISRDLCIGIPHKPSYTQEDSRVTAPAGARGALATR
ncbi:hypothetical protein M0802_004755 [Mischocyttarus mexicanus]|nr:hypothetical protein M0802_004755 [Mischocyttarus mexicanus]